MDYQSKVVLLTIGYVLFAVALIVSIVLLSVFIYRKRRNKINREAGKEIYVVRNSSAGWIGMLTVSAILLSSTLITQNRLFPRSQFDTFEIVLEKKQDAINFDLYEQYLKLKEVADEDSVIYFAQKPSNEMILFDFTSTMKCWYYSFYIKLNGSYRFAYPINGEMTENGKYRIQYTYAKEKIKREEVLQQSFDMSLLMPYIRPFRWFFDTNRDVFSADSNFCSGMLTYWEDRTWSSAPEGDQKYYSVNYKGKIEGEIKEESGAAVVFTLGTVTDKNYVQLSAYLYSI